MRCDIEFDEVISKSATVSIHTPTWGVTSSLLSRDCACLFQSTHLHEVWLCMFRYMCHFSSRFNPHTYMRCDIAFMAMSHLSVRFNPHTYMRCDNFYILRAYFWSFNPHTYMRCDGYMQKTKERNGCFNPHTYMRCDIWSSTSRSYCFSFNPHTYMRCDCMFRYMCHFSFCFNPHTYMRCDIEFNILGHTTDVSIHTPTWGVTWSHGWEYWKKKVSIHTPTWGVTLSLSFVLNLLAFQSTHLHEVWHRN